MIGEESTASAKSVEGGTSAQNEPLTAEIRKNKQKRKQEEKVAGRIDESGPQPDQPEMIKVLLVDDHQLVREALRTLIEKEEDIAVIAEAKNGIEAVRLVDDLDPSIVVMDINMPKMNGIKATKKILNEHSLLRIIGLSIHDEKYMGESIKEAGASVYLSKDEAAKTLCNTIRKEYATL